MVGAGEGERTREGADRGECRVEDGWRVKECGRETDREMKRKRARSKGRAGGRECVCVCVCVCVSVSLCVRAPVLGSSVSLYSYQALFRARCCSLALSGSYARALSRWFPLSPSRVLCLAVYLSRPLAFSVSRDSTRVAPSASQHGGYIFSSLKHLGYW